MICIKNSINEKIKTNITTKKEYIRKTVIDYTIKELMTDINNILDYSLIGNNVNIIIERKIDMVLRFNGFSNFLLYIKSLNLENIDQLTADNPENIYYIFLESENEIISYISIEDIIHINSGRINNICTLKECRRNKYGSLLLSIGFVFCKKILGLQYLITNTNTDEGIKLMYKFNFDYQYIDDINIKMNPFTQKVNPNEFWHYYNFLMDVRDKQNINHIIELFIKIFQKDKKDIILFFTNTYFNNEIINDLYTQQA